MLPPLARPPRLSRPAAVSNDLPWPLNRSVVVGWHDVHAERRAAAYESSPPGAEYAWFSDLLPSNRSHSGRGSTATREFQSGRRTGSAAPLLSRRTAALPTRAEVHGEADCRLDSLSGPGSTGHHGYLRGFAERFMNYEDLSREQLLQLHLKRETELRIGLVWEKDEIEREKALNEDFVAMDLDVAGCRGPAPWPNLLITGENFDALRWLRMTYRERIRLIYIDPNYNTLNRDWVYNDSFVGPDDNFKHSKWLEWMHQRLLLARDLLAPDGAIFVSIDDHEGPYLKVLMDQVFGMDMFVASFIWRKVDSPNDNKVKVAPDHEYIHCYASSRARARWKRLSSTSILDGFTQTDSQGRLYRDRILRKNGKNSRRVDRPTMYFALTAPDGSKVHPIRSGGGDGCWSHSLKGIKEMDREGRLIWKQVGNERSDVGWVAYAREFAPKEPDRPFPTIWTDVMTTRQTKAHHKDMFPGVEPFVTVKPEQLIARIVGMATDPGDIVLDFFLGSGTTAAVATKMGRRWIGVEQTGETAEAICLRLDKVAEGEEGGISDAVGWEGGEVTFARVATVKIPFEDLAYDLTPEQVWLTIQAMHGLPLTPLSRATALSVAAHEGGAVAYCDRFHEGVEAEIREAVVNHPFLVIYAYTPQPVSEIVQFNDRVEVRAIPDELVRRFQG